VVLGCGGVGRALLREVAREGHPAEVVAVCDSRAMLRAGGPGGVLSAEALGAVVAAKERRSGLSATDSDEGAVLLPLEEGLRALLADAPDTCTVVADCTATDDVAEHLCAALEGGYGVALANKKPVTGSLALWRRLRAHRELFRWESTCGAGTPFISSLQRLVEGGDRVHRISGAFSGTLGYVMSGVQGGAQAFSEVVSQAQAQGFTEPDPRDDLNGVDVARKALILARMLGWELELSDVSVESLFPEEMSPERMPLEQFMQEGLPELDAGMRERVAAAEAKGARLRFAATVEGGQCRVGLVEAAASSGLGQLQGADNILEVSSDIYSDSPLIIQGAGAGFECTAMGVLGDAQLIYAGSLWRK